MKDKQIYVSRKHVGIRIVIFVLALIIGITFLSLYFTGVLQFSKGYFKTDYYAENSNLNNTEIEFYTYFDGSNSSRRKYSRNLSDIYSKEANYINKLLDSENTYDGVINLAYINLNRDQDLIIEKTLYDILYDSYNKTLKKENYSIFSSSLYKTWNIILISTIDDKVSVSTSYKERIDEGISLVSNLDNFNIEFKNNNVINLHVSDDYLNYLNEYQLSSNIIDLNILKDAYIIEYLASKMRENNYLNSYFISSNGYILSLDGYESSFNLYTISNDYIRKYSSYNINKLTSYVFYYYFDINSNRVYKLDNNYIYNIVNLKDGKTSSIANSYLSKKEGISLVEQGFNLLNLTSLLSTSEINIYIKDNSLKDITYCIKEDIYSTNLDNIKVVEEKYKLHLIN